MKLKLFDPPFRYQIAPDERDCLHELLDDLGGEPSLCSLLGATGTVNTRDIHTEAWCSERLREFLSEFTQPRDLSIGSSVYRVFESFENNAARE